ncbi:MAG: Polysulfide reductase [Dehalococcoidia bacterium]|nr:Polysulfide reductase [Dehalococcoidia bacterium]
MEQIDTVVEEPASWSRRLERRVMNPLIKTGQGYWIIVALLALVVAWGVYAYSTQLRDGLIVTGMRDRIQWGIYIISFVFFIGISHAGTLISAILRVAKAGWRTPVTRIAEFITVVALSIGGLMPIIDLGRPDRIHHMFIFGRWQSPILWDLLSITTYLTGSIIYLYLPLIPDLARCRDRLGNEAHPWKRAFYRLASVGWQGTEKQHKYLRIAMGCMMVLIIPVAVSVHTVVSWIFGMTLREPWNSTVFGAYFVAGAIYSGIATIIIIMVILRRVYHLEEYITRQHFINLGYMLGAFVLIMLYFNVLEYVTTGYKLAGEGRFHFQQLMTGPFAPAFWFYILGGMVVPGLIILNPGTRTIPGLIVASIFVDIGMWLERFIIVVTGLRVPLMPYAASWYTPTWVEWSVMAAAFAGFGLIIAVFVKLFPVISIWEVEEHREHQEAVRVAEQSLQRLREEAAVTQPASRTAFTWEGRHESS